jgi:peptide deformylase
MKSNPDFQPKYELVPADDPILREVQPEFDFLNPPTDPVQLAVDLAEHMMYYNGIGLAAPQLGLPYRAFVLRSDPILAVFNPIITDFSSEQTSSEEGCLSFPHLFFKVKRPNAIKVRYYEPNGNVQNKKWTGMSARAFLHEFDHLEGILYIDYASDLKLQFAKKRAEKYKPVYDFETAAFDQKLVDKIFETNAK